MCLLGGKEYIFKNIYIDISLSSVQLSQAAYRIASFASLDAFIIHKSLLLIFISNKKKALYPDRRVQFFVEGTQKYINI